MIAKAWEQHSCINMKINIDQIARRSGKENRYSLFIGMGEI